MLSAVWVGFLVLSFVCGAIQGKLDNVTAAVSSGAAEAITLALGIAGLMCFWSGIMELVRASGLAEKLSGVLSPMLRPLFGAAAEDKEAMELVSANVTANLLGLSNAATPLGLRAVNRLYTVEGKRGSPDSVLTLITLNTASIQLIPSTVAAVRAACGSASPFDIMPAVWGASIASVFVVLLSGRLLRPIFPE